MRRLLVACGIGLIVCAAAYSADSVKGADDPAYSPAYFWLWNDRLDVAKLCAQLEDMHAHGLRNVCIHPLPKAFRPVWCSTKMEPDYLTPQFIDVFAKVVRRAGELGMHAYLYDEGGWPSGGACGLVAASDKEGRLAQRDLALDKDGGVVVRKRPYPQGRAAYPSVVEKGTTQKFIELTHEAYAKRLGKDLGTTSRIVFTDEPNRPANRPELSFGWTADFPEMFKVKKGYDIMPHMPELIRRYNAPDDRLAKLRIDVQDVMADLFVERYLLPLRDWCRAHGVLSGGHLNGEDVPEKSPEYGHGSVLRSLRAMDVPGVDTIWRQLFPSVAGMPAVTLPFPRYASSAMHQNGGRFALSESFAIYGDSVTPAQMKWVVDYQMVRGINTFVFGAYAQSNAGAWMTAFEPHSGPVTPYWDFQPHWFKYVERSCRFVSQGRPGAEIAVLYDVRGLWAGGFDRETAAWNHYAIAKTLDRMNCDYDFVDDDQIAAAVLLPGGRLKIGDMTYRAVVLPTSKWMLDAAKKKCEEFKSAGGILASADDISAVPRTLALSGAYANDFRVMKRKDGDRSIWVVMNEAIYARPVSLSFPEKGAVVRYDAESDRYELLSHNGCFRRTFAGGETSIFITGEVPEAKPPAVYGGRHIGVANGWTVKKLISHEAGESDFEIKKCDDEARSTVLGDWRPMLGDDFSGKALYQVEFDSPKEGRAKLDLGDVKWCASVKLNGIECGVRFFGPFVWEIDVKKGKNILEVTVANLLANQTANENLRDRVQRQFPPKSPYDWQQRVFDRENHDSGLYGPVTIHIEK
jgi:hypothetical protein